MQVPIGQLKGGSRWKAFWIKQSENCRLPSGQRQTPNLSFYTRQKLIRIGWDDLLDMPYSAVLENSNYRIHRKLSEWEELQYSRSLERPHKPVPRPERYQVLRGLNRDIALKTKDNRTIIAHMSLNQYT